MSRRRLGVAQAIVDGAVVAGDVELDGATVARVGVHPAARRGTAVPGFIDLQVNGFAGVTFTHAEADGYAKALDAMARHGVVACLPTMPTTDPARYGPALATLADVVAQPPPGARVLGAHLEGPFLNPQRRGAHPAAWLHAADVGLLDAFLDAGPVALVTLAPELAGAMALIERLRRRGVLVSLGHSDATAAVAHAAFDAGASMVTHLWNAQRPITAREPGVTGAALARSDVHVGIIADLVHVAADTVRLSLAAAGLRAFVVTDALAPAGVAAATTSLEGGPDRHRDAIAVRLGDGTLAGSALPMDAALRNLVAIGLALPLAVGHLTCAPAAALQRSDLGRMAPGCRADVAILDDQLNIRATFLAGTPHT